MKKILSLAIMLILTLLLIHLSQYEKLIIIDDRGYAIRNSDISRNLRLENLEAKNKYVETVKFNSYDILYKQASRIFIGEDKNIINEMYPLYTNNNLTLINIDDDSKLIDENFKKEKMQKYYKISNGKVYDINTLENIGDDNYIFLNTYDNMNINLSGIKIKTQTNEYKIKMNSIINFSENYISMFSPNSKNMEYTKISDIDNNSIIYINEKEYTYEDFLTRLNNLPKHENNVILDENKDALEDEKDKDDNNDNIKEDLPNEEIEYVKPTVTIDDFKENVYSIKANIKINDPTGRITEEIVVNILQNNQLFLKRKFSSGGNANIVGLRPNSNYQLIATFRYKNEENKIKEVTITNYNFTTKSMDELNPIDISYENGDIYNNQVNLKNLKINNNITDEVMKGIKKVTLKLNDRTYNLKNTEINNIINGRAIDILTEKNINSNSKIDYQFLFYDLFGNELKVNNAFGVTNTSKLPPTANVLVEENNVTSVKLKTTVSNKDSATLTNLKYKLFYSNGSLAEENSIDESLLINLKKVSSDEVYTIKIYGDYDLNDGRGYKKEQILGENNFTTKSITSLGYLKLNVNVNEITNNSIDIKIKINSSTDYRLIELLSKVSFRIYTKDEEEQSNEFIRENYLKPLDYLNENSIYMHSINGNMLEQLKNGEEINVKIDNLNANQKYYIDFTSVATQFNKNYEQEAFNTLKSFITLKHDAEVIIKNLFVTEKMIDFDAALIDIDNAISDGIVTMQVRNDKNQLIASDKINAGEDLKRYTYDKLEENKNYTFTFIASEYNIGSSNNTYKDNYIVKEMVVNTKVGINGNINLVSLTNRSVNKNYLIKEKQNFSNWNFNKKNSNFTDISYNSNTNENIFKLTTNSSFEQIYTGLNVTRGKTYTLSFKIYQEKLYSGGNLNVHILKNAPTNSNPNTGTYLNDNKSTKVVANKKEVYTLVTLTFVANNDLIYIDFNFGPVRDGQKDLVLKIKDIQMEEGTEATEYITGTDEDGFAAEVISNIYDTRHETNLDYYIRIYKNGEFINTHEYKMDPDYKKENVTNLFSVEKNKSYKMELCVKISDLYYVIDSTEFTTEKEIYAIKNTDDFFNMNSSRKYIVLNDLDFTKINRIYQTFSGTIDFNGHTVILNVQNRPSYLINQTSSTAVLKNINLIVNFDNIIERQKFWGLINSNYGTIENIMVTTNGITDVPNISFSAIGANNYGTLKKFVIHQESPLHGESSLALGFINNYKNISDGYLYGENIDASYRNMINTNKYVGGLVAYASSNSNIKNVFSLINVDTYSENSPHYTEPAEYNESIIGNIVALQNSGVVQNTYSIGEGRKYNLNIGPSLGSVWNTSAKNNYYISDNIYTNTYNLKMSPLSTHDSTFQNRAINSNNAFIVDDLVDIGYFPQIDFPDCMKAQDLIELNKVSDEDLIDITYSDVIENTNSEAKIIFTVNNPGSDIITNIEIQNVEVEILDQTYSNGKSKVTARVYNPRSFVSRYYVSKIESRGAYGIINTRTYSNNERILFFDMYKGIRTADEFKNIKATENYILEQDIDFSTHLNYRVSPTYSGKFNGNNHTLRNITITSGNPLFSTVSGEIKNLFVENYKLESSPYYSGLIYSTTRTTNLENVHLKNAYIRGYNMLGGLIGRVGGGTMTNCSVSDINFAVNKGSRSVYLGGMIGYADYLNIKNCFAQNINIELNNLYNTSGIGGMFGYTYQSSIENVYVTGNIKTRYRTTGGLIGYANSNTSITKAISNVDIIIEGEYVGGIAGQSNFNSASNLLYMGSVYSKNDISNIKRISGTQSLSSNIYSTQDRKFNGKYYDEVNDSNKLYSPTYGEKLVPIDKLRGKSYYELELKLNSDWNYNNVDNSIMPKLNYYGTNELLPNQNDILIKEDLRNVTIVAMNKKVQSIDLVINIDNPQELEVTKIDFDALTYIDFGRCHTENGLTQIAVTVTPNKYYDSYKLLGIHFNDQGQDKYIDANLKINARMYKLIDSVDAWNKLEPNAGENIMIIKDLDFKNNTSIVHNISANRFVGAKDNIVGDEVKLSNIKLNLKSPATYLISSINSETNNINFENVTITNSATTGDYTGIYGLVYGNVYNLNFKNVIIDAPKINYVGIFANNSASSFKNSVLEKINVKGLNYTGALSGNSGGLQYCVVATDIIVNGSDRTGGISGRGSSTNFIISDANVVGRNYTGTAFGELSQAGTYSTNTSLCNSNINSLFETYRENNTKTINNDGSEFNIYDNRNIVEKSSVRGNSRVGGAVGTGGALFNTAVNEVEIKSTGNDIGGFGGCVATSNPIVYDTNINKDSVSSSSNVGGILGYGGSTANARVVNMEINTNGGNVGGINGSSGSINTSRAVNVTINSSGGNIGGIAGYSSTTLVNSYAYNTIINGKNNMGGIVGSISYGANITNNYNNTIINSTGNNVGGIIGYVTNQNMTLLSNRIYIKNNMAISGSITGSNYVGGIIGNSSKEISDLNNAFHSFILAEDIRSTGSDANAFIGKDNTDISNIRNFKVYDNSKINDNNIFDVDLKLSDINRVSKEDLSVQDTYVDTSDANANNHSFSPSIWNYTPLASGYFPTNKNTSADTNHIPLPADISTFSLSGRMMARAYMLNRTLSLPNVSIYPSGVDKINIELDNNFEYAYLTINKVEIDDLKKVNTFTYNYKDKLEITISNGYRDKTYIIKPKSFNILASVYNDKYYLINNKRMITNGISKLNNYKFIHLYKNTGLTDNLEIVNLESGDIISKINNDIKLTDTVPIHEFKYNNYNIKTYNNYSTSNDKDINNILLVKNNTLEVLDSNLAYKRNSIIIDNHSNYSYTTILGEDNKIYNLKKNIKLPNGFINKNIKYMTNNLYTDTNYVVVIYENNRGIIFDYTDGKIIYDTNNKSDINLLSYIKSIIDSNTNLVDDNLYNSYKSSKKLANKVNNISIDEAIKLLNKDSNSRYSNINISNDNKYISVYNNFSKKYEVYNIDEILNSEKIVSVDSKINSNMNLLKYYSIPDKTFNNENNFALIIIIIIISIITLGIGYLILFRKEQSN